MDVTVEKTPHNPVCAVWRKRCEAHRGVEEPECYEASWEEKNRCCPGSVVCVTSDLLMALRCLQVFVRDAALFSGLCVLRVVGAGLC